MREGEGEENGDEESAWTEQGEAAAEEESCRRAVKAAREAAS